jgi:hypothetical protein
LRKRILYQRNTDVLLASRNGTSWSPDAMQGRHPVFNLNQLTRIHAMALEGSLKLRNFIQRRWVFGMRTSEAG